jgi:hypothetical protein
MHDKALKYLATESIGSAIVNGLLNAGAAWLLFHGRVLVPVKGPLGIVRDLIGETFLVASLSYMAAVLISRHRGRAGKLPQHSTMHLRTPGNVYLWSLAVGVICACVLVPLNAIILPRALPAGLTFRDVILFKTSFGAVLGGFVTWFAISRALNEAHSPVLA